MARTHAGKKENPAGEGFPPRCPVPVRPAPANSTEETVMANLVPRDTFFHAVADFRRNFDQVFNRLVRWSCRQEESTYANEFSPAVEAFIDKDNKKFHCEVVPPGVDPKDVDIQVQGNTLTITGERTNSRETREADFLQREITYGFIYTKPGAAGRRGQRSGISR